MTKPQKIEGGWEERLLDLFTEDENHHLHLIDGSYSLESFISDLLASERQRCVEEEKERLLDEISDEFGNYDDGCGCCARHTLQEMLSKKYPSLDQAKHKLEQLK
jgi:hypothetical protein